MRDEPNAAPAAPARAAGGDPAAWAAGLELVFHGDAWAALVAEVYGVEPLPVSRPGGALPLFHTRSPLLGAKLVSAVFNGYAGPRAAGAEACAELLEEAAARARARRVRYLEVRCLAPLPPSVVARAGLVRRDPYRVTLVPLGRYATVEGRYERRFRKNLRAGRRRLAAAGVRIERSDERADLRRFHDLLVRRLRDRHAMLAQPFALFEALHRRFLRSGEGDLWVARDASGRLRSGHLFLRRGGVVTGGWAATDAADPRWCLDAVVKDEAIRHYCADGASVCDLGLSSPRQPGLLFAKSRFGGITLPTPFYYHLVGARRPPERDFADAYRWLRRPYRHVPLPVARRLSALLVPHLT